MMGTEADQVLNEWLKGRPLLKFSLYTATQVETLKAFGKELLGDFDAGVTYSEETKQPIFERKLVSDGYAKFWLWLLGAYEVVRTMAQAPECFSPNLVEELRKLKKRLSKIRMPFAKQEIAGQDVPVYNELSIADVEANPADLVFVVQSERISARSLVEDFIANFDAIRGEEVLLDHRLSNRYKEARAAGLVTIPTSQASTNP